MATSTLDLVNSTHDVELENEKHYNLDKPCRLGNMQKCFKIQSMNM